MTNQAETVCPKCGGQNSPALGGTDSCFHCADCGYVGCVETYTYFPASPLPELELIERIARLEQQLKTVLDRESASQKRHDAKLDELEQQLANARREALTTGADKIASLIRRSSFPGTIEFNDGIAEAHCAILALIAKEPQS